MERLRRLFKHPESSALLFCIALLLFSWPVLAMKNLEKPLYVTAWVYSSWALVILVLFLIARIAQKDR